MEFCKQGLVIILSLAISACGGGGSYGEPSSPPPAPPPAAAAPVANAGSDATVQELALVTLSGSATDANGDDISYSWVQTGGTSIELSNADTPTASFTAPDVTEGNPEVLTFELTASDPGNLSGTDEVEITVEDPPSLTTTYCHGGFNKLLIHNDNGLETYEVVMAPLGSTVLTATGSRNGNSLLLQATSGDFSLDYDVTISSDEATVTAAIDVSFGDSNIVLNEYGTLGDCATFDLDNQAVPQLATADFTDVATYIEDISLFRSAAGHDYSDSFESCRSMKHYFSPKLEERLNNNVPVFAPFAGTIVLLNTEWEGFVDDGVTDQRVFIRSESNPAVLTVLFHIDLMSNDLVVGSTVTSGEQLGHARMDNNGSVTHDFDIGAHINTAAGVRYVSYFELMGADIFSGYSSFGANRSDFIITEPERDADPLTCDGETFTTTGSLWSWIFGLFS
ncbi:MAG: hypothetical protein CMO98_01730 [Woeseia sp.]|nr:hypothetical protein [Woeseia sp.]|tara:strand:- start:656 stop:2008 length:1353 start_codon:yes stop_codon:yes gene_type:complete